MRILTTAFGILALTLGIILAAPAGAQDRYNPNTGQWEYTPQPNMPAGGGAAFDGRTGTYFMPSGDGGKTNTQDGTQWHRSGDTLINSRTGQMYHDPFQND